MASPIFNAGLISIVFISIFIILRFVMKQKNAPSGHEPYACGEAGENWGSGSGLLYSRLYKTLRIEKIDKLHNGDLNEYVSWMFVAVVAAIAVFAILGA